MTKVFKVVSTDAAIPVTEWPDEASALLEATRIAEANIGLQVEVLTVVWRVVRVTDPD